jgi:hypothetical protein
MRWHALLVTLLPLAGCGGDHDHPEGAEEHAAHPAHAPRMGGVLVELGEHELQLEIVHDAQAGRLIVYVWDGHVEHPVRTAATGAPATVEIEGGEVALELLAQADELTGETVGDSARFEVTDPRLAGREAVAGRLGPIAIAGRDWGPVDFRVP